MERTRIREYAAVNYICDYMLTNMAKPSVVSPRTQRVERLIVIPAAAYYYQLNIKTYMGKNSNVMLTRCVGAWFSFIH
jgi:hypothetical protein